MEREGERRHAAAVVGPGCRENGVGNWRASWTSGRSSLSLPLPLSPPLTPPRANERTLRSAFVRVRSRRVKVLRGGGEREVREDALYASIFEGFAPGGDF